MANKKLTEKEEKKLKEALEETISGSRIFEVEGFGLVKVVFPSIEDSRKADYYYSKYLNEAMLDGLMTQEEMLELLNKKGIWTEEHERKIAEMEKEAKSLATLASKMQTEKAKNEYTKKMTEVYNKIDELRQKKRFYLANTAESKAEQERLGYLLYRCAYNAETGERLWKSFDDFRNERRQREVSVIAYNFLAFLSGLDEETLGSSPQINETDLGGGTGETSEE
jgi:hypothetical protein